MREPTTIGNATLYLGDCLEILPTLGKVDAVVTDIPYEISQVSGGLRRLDYGDWDGIGSTDVALAALGHLSDVPSILAWCFWEQLASISGVLPGRSCRPIIWRKPNPTVANGQHLFLPFGEIAYYGKLAGGWFGGHCEPAMWTGSPPADREHPTQKPIKLMEWCVSRTVAAGAVCLDPFMGSGTTGVACAKLGRRFIGIEIEPRYFDIACKRIEQAYAQPDLFIEPPRKAEQAGMDL